MLSSADYKDSLFSVRCVADLGSAADRSDRGDISRSVVEAAKRHATSDVSATLAYVSALSRLQSEDDPAVRAYLSCATASLLAAYPTLPPRSQRLLKQSLCLVLVCSVRSGGDLVDQLVPPLLMRSCSRRDPLDPPPFSRLVSPLTGLTEERLFPYYRDLWTETLTPTDRQTLGRLFALHADYEREVGVPLLDAIVGASLRFVSSADLSYERNEEGDFLPASVADQELLVNLSVVIESVLSGSIAVQSSRWLSLVGEHVVAASMSHPAVSALYRLLHSFVRAAQQTCGERVPASIVAFADELIAKLPEFDGELLDAAIGFVLGVGGQVRGERLEQALSLSLRTGVRALEAVNAITAIDRAHLPDLIPLLATYLVPTADRCIDKSQMNNMSRATRRRVAAAQSEEEAAALSDAVVRLLGRLGGINKTLLQLPQKILLEKEGVTADALTMAVAMPTSSKADVPNLVIDLAAVAPKLVRLSASSGDSQTQLLAAELLQGVLVFMVGSGASMMNRSNNLSPMYRSILPAAINLSVSSNSMIAQLYSLLLSQLAHWFSGANHVHEDDATALIDSLIDCACNSADGRIKAAAVKTTEEFFVWSLRQRRGDGLPSRREAVLSLLGQIFILCGHSAESKRAAAVLLLSRLCVHFREEGSLVQQTVLAVVLELLKCLRLPSSDSLKHNCIRCIRAYVDVIDKSVRRMDDCFKLVAVLPDRDPACIADLVSWTWAKLSTPSCTLFRDTAMSVCARLVPLIYAKNEPLPLQCYLRDHSPTPSQFEAEVLQISLANIDDAVLREDWMLSVCAASHCYRWLLDISLDFAALISRPPPDTARKRKHAAATDNASRLIDCIIEMCEYLRTEAVSNLEGDFYRRIRVSFAKHIVQLMSHLLDCEQQLAIRLTDAGFLDFVVSLTIDPSSSPDDAGEICRILGANRLLLRLFELNRQHLESTKVWLKYILSGLTGLIDAERGIAICALVLSALKNNSLVECLLTWGETSVDISARLVRSSLELSVNADASLVHRLTQVVHLCVNHLDLSIHAFLQLLQELSTDPSSLKFEDIAKAFLNVSILPSTLNGLREVAQSRKLKPIATRFISSLLSVYLEQSIEPDATKRFIQSIVSVSDFCLSHLASLAALNSRLPVGCCDLDVIISKKIASTVTSKQSTCDDVVDALMLGCFILPGTTLNSPRKLSATTVDISVITDALEDMVAQRYPLNSQQLDPSSASGKDFGVLLGAHLDLIANTGCVALFDQLTPLLKEGAKHRYYTKISSAFNKIGATCFEDGSFSCVSSILVACTCIFTGTTVDEIRSFMATNLVLPLLQKCSTTALQFILCQSDIPFCGPKGTSIIKQLVNTIQNSNDIFNQSIAYKICSMAYDRLSIEVIRGGLSQAYVGAGSVASGKELTLALTMACTTEVAQPESPLSSCLVYNLRTAALNCLLMVVCKTQSSEKFYDAVFAKTNWECVIDCRISYNFHVSSFPSITIGADEQGQSDFSVYSRPTMSSILSQNSLFSLSSQMTQTQSFEPSDERPSDTATPAAIVKGLDDYVIVLELNHLNQQECMSFSVRAMQRIGVLFADAWKSSSPQAPFIVQHFKKMIGDFTVHVNVRLFFLRLLLNKPVCDILQPFADTLLDSVLACTIADLCLDGFISYFIKDVVFLLCHPWAAVKPPLSSFRQASILVSKLFCAIANRGGEQGGYKENTACVVSLLRFWLEKDKTGTFDCELDPLLSLLSTEHSSTGGAHGKAGSQGSDAVQRRIAGLMIISEILDSSHNLKKTMLNHPLKSSLLDCMKFPRKEVFILSSRAIGALLSAAKVSNNEVHEQLSQSVESLLMSRMSQKDGFDTAAATLFSLSKRAPSFLPREVFLRLMSGFTSLKSRGKLEFLSCLVNCTSELAGISFVEYLSPHIITLLRDLFSNGKIQLAVLQLLNKQSATLSQSVVEIIHKSSIDDTGIVSLLVSQQSTKEVRLETFKFLVTLQKAGKANFNRQILKGLLDMDDEGMEVETGDDEGVQTVKIGIRRRVLDHFNESLPRSPEQRMVYLMTDLFRDADEDDWVSVSSYLMLVLNKDTRAFDSPLFDKDLGDCVFQSVQLRKDRSAATHPMTPTFSFDRTQSLLTPSQASRVQSSQSSSGNIRGTQIYKWSQTQTASASQNILSEGDATDMGPPVGMPLYREGKNLITQEGIARSQSAFIPRAAAAIAMHDSRSYRKYREGELPDVKILGRDIVKPLSVLSLFDKSFAVSILCRIFEGLYEELHKNSKKNEAVLLLKSALQSMLQRKSSSGSFGEFVITACLSVIRIEQSASFDSNLVCGIGLNSLRQYGAILFVEEQLMCLSVDNEPDERRSHLACLSVLYGSLNESDVLTGLSSLVAEGNDTINQALESEIKGDYTAAIQLYSSAIDQTSMSSSLSKIWEERVLESLRQLGEWDELAERVNHSLVETGMLLDSDRSLNLSRMIQTNSYELLFNYFDCLVHDPEERRKDALAFFLKNLFTGDTGTNARQLLEERQPVALALALAINKDWSAALRLTKRSRASFLDQWNSLHELSFEARKTLLQSLQCSVELDDASREAAHVQKVQHSDSPSFASYPSLDDPLSVWHNLVTVRCSVSNKTTEFATLMVRFHENLSYAALYQGALPVVKKSLRVCSQLRAEYTALKESAVRETEIVTLYNLHNIHKKGSKPNDVLAAEIKKSLTQTLTLINKKLDYAQSNREIPSEIFQLQVMRANWLRIISSLEGKHETLAAYEAYKAILVESASASGTLYGEVADFTEEILLQRSSGFDYNEVASTFASVISSGLAFGDSRCRELVLRLLSIIGEYTSAGDALLARLSLIPPWVFLQNIAQLMSRLECPEGIYAVKLVEAAAKKYPFAVCYQFKLIASSFADRSIALLVNLRKLLNLPAVDCFVEALQGLTHPEMRWSDALSELDGLVKTGGASTKVDATLSSLRSCIESNWIHVGTLIGDYNKKFARKYSKEVTSILDGKDTPVSKLKKLHALSAAKNLSLVGSSCGSGKVPLLEFSGWLANFDSVAHKLEIPGQYCLGMDREPRTEFHTMIAGIDQSLLVMDSKRKPKRITFIGNDGKEYPFLCKGGEDLRNDERIISIMDLMNTIVNRKVRSNLFSDSLQSPYSNSLSVKTYTVIPMTVSVGLLEWVVNTVPLKMVFEHEILKDGALCKTKGISLESKTVGLDALVTTSLSKWMPSHDSASYHAMYKSKKSKDARSAYENLLKGIPKDLLRRKLLSMSSSPPEFLAIRTEYARSLATSSIFGYILGLGDRHLENILLDSKCGRLIHIDFGICFGVGASYLPVPELIPFRLTPQLSSALQPLDDSSVLRFYMIKVLQLLQSSGGVKSLSNALEIYLNDPVVDWLKDAAKRDDSDSSSSKWEPARRVNLAIRKLKGLSPVAALLDELSNNSRVEKLGSLPALQKIIEECKFADSLDAEHCDVSAQVDELMRLSTDPNILSRQWVGLTTWI